MGKKFDIPHEEKNTEDVSIGLQVGEENIWT
jgi:hypothetical protein